ncbi:helix-turn-helix transcriptional regulator [Pseudonocardia sp. TRM90224]|uniref:helix-turn-helix transcriptional regulator n=1 Tax=Pseudonocardia sp. TRM90224 TaxID=2812678 RepID=UPI001E431489|nr:PAS domain-containing protein [Pseudonocardia sp. TRM90224]
MLDWLRPQAPVCEALAALLAPHGEVVVHDLTTGRIAQIWNPMSGRDVGDDSLLDITVTADGPEVYGPYAKVLPDGRACTSISAVLTDADGKRRGLLCVNLDRSPLDRIAALATSLLAPRTERPPQLFDRDWRERMTLRVHEFCRDRALTRDQLDRNARRELVAVLDAEGLFEMRRSTELAAETLGVSRATLYALLKEVRS